MSFSPKWRERMKFEMGNQVGSGSKNAVIFIQLPTVHLEEMSSNISEVLQTIGKLLSAVVAVA